MSGDSLIFHHIKFCLFSRQLTEKALYTMTLNGWDTGNTDHAVVQSKCAFFSYNFICVHC